MEKRREMPKYERKTSVLWARVIGILQEICKSYQVCQMKQPKVGVRGPRDSAHWLFSHSRGSWFIRNRVANWSNSNLLTPEINLGNRPSWKLFFKYECLYKLLSILLRFGHNRKINIKPWFGALIGNSMTYDKLQGKCCFYLIRALINQRW